MNSLSSVLIISSLVSISAVCKTTLKSNVCSPVTTWQTCLRLTIFTFNYFLWRKKIIKYSAAHQNIAVQFSLLIKRVCFNSHFLTCYYKMGIIRSQDVDLALGFLLVFDHKWCHNPQGRRKGRNHEKTTTLAVARRHKQFQRPNSVAGSPLEHKRQSGFMCMLTVYDNCSLPGGGRPPPRVERALHACVLIATL